MAIYSEYATVTDVRSTYLSVTANTDDALILQQIREASQMIESSAKRQLVPIIQSQSYDIPHSTLRERPYITPNMSVPADPLFFDTDMLEVLSLTNGDGTTITPSQYWLYPRNYSVKTSLKLRPSSGVAWQLNSVGDEEQVITVNAVWGYHADYNHAWVDTVATLAAAITSTSATTFICTTGKLKAGWLIKIDSEYMYVSAVSTGSSDTVTVVRGVNGSTAATHLISSVIYYWVVNYSISSLCQRATAALYELRQTKNPISGKLILDGQSIEVPGDVASWIDKQINIIGIERGAIG